MGKNNTIGAYCVIGGDGEIRKRETFEGSVIIGDDNIISELVTIQRPQKKGCSTIIGNSNMIMAHSHIGHDSTIGSNCEVSTGSIIGGYATIHDGSMIKLRCVIRNRVTIGKNCIVGMGSVVVKHCDSDSIYVGNPARLFKKK
jgi:acyl-[acyl carrier protein]--UDP-N-acetylglucosamine O-acyltransferase